MKHNSAAVVVILVLTFLTNPSLTAKEKGQYRIGSFAKYLQIVGASKVGSDNCATCHSEEAGDFKHAFHGQRGIECEDCHGAGSLHVDSSGEVSKILSFRSRPAEAANGVCLSCHARDEKVRNWLAGSHAADRVRCADCHHVHSQQPKGEGGAGMNFDALTPGRAALAEKFVPESSVKLAPRWQANDSCLRCHRSQRAEMLLPYHHPLREGKMSCTDCHDPHGGPAGKNLRTATINQLCLSCHAQYRGPFMYQHPPVNENCLNCHASHGSPNTNLLSVSIPALCLQCHSGHHDGAGLPLVDRCTNCHGSIHGTDVPTPTGGSRFVDKGGLGVPGFPQPSAAGGLNRRSGSAALRPLPAHASTLPARLVPNHAIVASSGVVPTRYLSPMPSDALFALPQIASLIGALGAAFGAFPGTTSSGMPGSTGAGTGTYWGMNFTPGAYRFLNVTGYAGRVGEYDALEQSLGANLEGDYVSMPHRLSILTRGTVVNRSDFDLASQINLGEWLEAGASMRSFMEQQDNYPFYAGVISPDIETSLGIPDGTVFGVKRRMGEASAKVKLPGLPIRLFIKGGWQTRVGQNQLTFLDENTNSNCGETCHFSSKFQPLNYTTRNIGGGMEVNLGGMSLIYEHDFSSFNDRLAFPSANFGPMLNEAEPGPVFVPDTPAGAYYLDIPAPSHYSSDMLSLNWTLSPELMLNGRAAYRRMRDVFTHNPQSSLDSDITLGWHPLERVRITADFHQQNLVNNFVPYFALFGNMSYHEHRAGLSAEYEMSRHLDLEARYKRSGITRSNAFLWPQVYSFDNTDPQYVVPSSFGNTTGLTLRYHGGDRWSTRAGYEWTGTHAPGYVTVPKSNNRIFGNVTLTPAHWLALTNDLSVIVQNAFPVIQRRNRFYVETASATLVPAQDWMIDLGYSYQQNNLGTYMAFQNDSAAGYVVDEPFVPYRQLSQSYWIRSTYKFGQRLELNLGLSHNSAHSGMRPDVNPNDYLLLGNGSLPPESFDPVVFQQALGGLSLGSTLGSQVNVPQLIGQGKLSYLLPHGFDAGFLLYYGSYRDYTNPNLNGILRAYSIYLGRSW